MDIITRCVSSIFFFTMVNIAQAENPTLGTGYDFFSNYVWRDSMNYNFTVQQVPKLPANFGPGEGVFNSMVYSAVNPIRVPVYQALPYAPYPQLSAPKYVITEYKHPENITFETQAYQVKQTYKSSYEAKPIVPIVVKKIEPMIDNLIYSQQDIQKFLK